MALRVLAQHVFGACVRVCVCISVGASQWFRDGLFSALDRTRRALADYVNAPDVNDIVFVDNASAGVNAVLRSMQFDGDRDTVMLMDITYPMTRNAATISDEVEQRYKVMYMDANLPCSDAEIVQRVASFLDMHSKIRLIEVSHITSVPAVLLPIKEIIAECRKRDVLILIDGAHALGQVPINLVELDPDFYVANGHKWLYSSRGSGFLYVRRSLQATVFPPIISSRANHTQSFQMQWGYLGTKDYCHYLTILDALEFRKHLGGDDAIATYLHGLCVRGGDLCAEAWGTEKLVSDSQTAAMTNIRLPACAVQSCPVIADRLMRDYACYVPIFEYRGTLYCRVSAALYNGLSDYEYLATSMRKLITTLNEENDIDGGGLQQPAAEIQTASATKA